MQTINDKISDKVGIFTTYGVELCLHVFRTLSLLCLVQHCKHRVHAGTPIHIQGSCGNGKRGSWDKVTAHCHYSDGMKCLVRAFDAGFGRMNIVVIYGIGISKPTKMNNCFPPPVWNETKAVVQGTVELDGLSKLDGDILFLSDSIADALAECVVEPSGFFMSDKLYI